MNINDYYKPLIFDPDDCVIGEGKPATERSQRSAGQEYKEQQKHH